MRDDVEVLDGKLSWLWQESYKQQNERKGTSKEPVPHISAPNMPGPTCLVNCL